jgi:hypothetical protein
MAENDSATENAPLDYQDWEHAFEPYDGHPGQALMLGFNLMVLKTYLAVEPLNIEEANAGLDRAMEVLFQHTQFHEVAYGVFRRLVEGKITLEEEERLKALGLRF